MYNMDVDQGTDGQMKGRRTIMKKFFALILAVVMMLSVAAFAEEADTTATVMTHEEFVAAELESEVTVETYVQDKQSWWDNKATFYCQSEDGAYFIYEMPCTEDEYAQLVPGTKIRVTGYKAEWSGEVEITDATFEILEADPYIAEATDVTELLGTDELINHQNEKVAFTGLTVEAYDESGAAFAYKNDAEKTDDLYFKASYNGQTYDFCVEFYPVSYTHLTCPTG